MACASHATVNRFQIPYNQKIEGKAVQGQVLVDTAQLNNLTISKSFYGADTNGFNRLPSADNVTPLQLGYIKFGGSLHSVYNWNLNLYLDSNSGIQPVYAPLDQRIQSVKETYQATPMFQVNMMGMQPDYNAQGNLVMMNTADADHAANAIRFLNGKRGLGVKNILMGNEPFHYTEVHGVAIPSADEYIEKYIQYAVALRDAQVSIGGRADDLKLWGPELATGWTGWQTTHPKDCTVNYNVPGGMVCSYGNGQFTEFIPYFLSRIAAFEKDQTLNPKGYKLLDYLTLHYYPLFRTQFGAKDSVIVGPDGKQNVAGMLESVNLWTSLDYINKYDAASPKNVAPQIVNKFQNWKNSFYPSAKLAVTEFGVDSVYNIDYHPIVRPLYLADLMARVGEAGVDTFINSFLQGGRYSDKWGMINNDSKTRLYWIYSLFSKNYLGQVLQSTDTFGDKVNVYSVKTATGTNVILVNKDIVEYTTSLNLATKSGQEKAAELTLPAWSVTVASIPDNKGAIEIQQYGAKEMGITVIPQN
jgi:hypothetical protein